MADQQSEIDNLADDHLIGDKSYISSEASKATLQSVFSDYAAHFPDWEHSAKKTAIYRTCGPFIQRIRMRDVPHSKAYTIIMSVSCMVGRPEPMFFQTVQAHSRLFRYNYNFDIRYSLHSAERCAEEVVKIRAYFKPDISAPLTFKAISRRVFYRQVFIARLSITTKIGKAVLLASTGKPGAAKRYLKRALKAEKRHLRKHIKKWWGDQPEGIKVWDNAQPDLETAKQLISALDNNQYDKFIAAEMKAYKRQRL